MNNRHSRKRGANERVQKKSADELSLEHTLFGIGRGKPTLARKRNVAKPINNAKDDDNEEEELEFVITVGDKDIAMGRTGGNGAIGLTALTANSVIADQSEETKSAINSQGGGSMWHDEDDDALQQDIGSSKRLKKLHKPGRGLEQSSVINGTELSQLLQERYQTRELEWATVPKGDQAPAGGSETYSHATAADMQLLAQSRSLVLSHSQRGRAMRGAMGRWSGVGKEDARIRPHAEEPLKTGNIAMKRLVNANVAEPSRDSINAVKFHASGSLLLAAGADKLLRLFRIDGENNDKVLANKFDMAIACAHFIGRAGTEIAVAGRKPYYYSLDTATGTAMRIPGPAAHRSTLKSLEKMIASPEGSRIAVMGLGGFLHIADTRSKHWTHDVKMNCSVRSAAFLDECSLVSSGLDAEVYLWDLRNTARCVARFPHDDGTCTSFLSAYSPAAKGVPDRRHVRLQSAYLAVGAESGVVSLFCGKNNYYSSSDGSDSGASQSALGGFDFSSSCGDSSGYIGHGAATGSSELLEAHEEGDDEGEGEGAGWGGSGGGGAVLDPLLAQYQQALSAQARSRVETAGMGAGSAGKKATGGPPRQVKSIMNLTTAVTCSAFHPSGQLLAIASSKAQDQLKLVHLPSCSVFANWPTARTPLGRITCLDFSRSGNGLFAVGNNKGRVLLYKIPDLASSGAR